MIRNPKDRFGSAKWALEQEIRRAGLFKKGGLHLGFFNGRRLYHHGDGPMITFGGAGTGKQRDQLSYQLLDTPGMPMLVNDPRGELLAVSLLAHTLHGESALAFNPLRLCGLMHMNCNPLDILKPNAPSLHADARFIAQACIPVSGKGEDGYFSLKAQEWVSDILIALTDRDGQASFPSLMRMLNAIEGHTVVWTDLLRAMIESTHESVRKTAGEMITKQQDAPREFGSVMGEAFAKLDFLNDPLLLNSLDKPGFSLEALTDQDMVHKIFLNFPAEYLAIWAPLIRVFFTVAMLYKGRKPQARRVLFLVDEAAQLGRFDVLLRLYTYGRGAGILTHSVWQDVGQIEQNYGAAAVSSFIGSSQVRQFFSPMALHKNACTNS